MNMKKMQGFTLIELMIVVAIIGILAAVAIPQFASYRIKAFNTAAQSDLKGAATAYEVFFNDNSEYPKTVLVATGTATLDTAAGLAAPVVINLSKNVAFASVIGTTNQCYGAATKNAPGDKIYNVASDAPSMVEAASTAGTVLLDADVTAPGC